MIDNLLTQALEKFDKKERAQVEKYLQSPLLKVSPSLLKAFSYLKSNLQTGKRGKKIDLYRHIFGKEVKFNDHK